jgi:putative nucleotidyltransferase with HDIG domain
MLRKIDIRQALTRLIVELLYPLAGLAIFVSVVPEWEPREHWDVLFTYAVLTIVCTFAPISTFNARVTLNSAVIFSGILLYGTWAGIWSAAFELLIVSLLFRPKVAKVLANTGQSLITVWIVGTLYDWFTQFSIPWMITDLLLIILYWLSNTSLVALGISHFFKEPWLPSFKKLVTGASITYVLFMIIGAIGARLVGTYGILSLLPIGAAFVTIRLVFHHYFDSIHKLEQKVEEIRSLNNSFLIAMAASIDARDPYTSGHSQRVAHWGREIAIAMGLPKEKVEEVYFGGILHDIGKIGIEDEILNKDGKLTPEEFNKIKQHTVIGYEIVKQAGVFQELLPAIRSHHERIDGRGYPDGLSGEEIPLVARILAISDAFDAMVSDRPYREGMPVSAALKQIEDGAGTQFDEKLAYEFVKLIRNLPPEELAAIIEQGDRKKKRRHLQEALL